MNTSSLSTPTTSHVPRTSPRRSRTIPTVLTLHSRFASILHDSEFVLRVAERYPGLPLLANERCGSWYIPPKRKNGSVYFKSTDGHVGEWGFSARRLNLQVFDQMIEGEGMGCIIVDSTRRGKMMPDALSKTVPIWCAVWNRVLFPDDQDAGRLFTPPGAVGSSEHARIEARLEVWVEKLKSIDLDIESLRIKVRKPLRPVWITPETDLSEHPMSSIDRYAIILCTASRRVQGAESSEDGYIQGAADDAESWAYGLSPDIFWKDRELLMSLSEEELQMKIPELTETTPNDVLPCPTATAIPPASRIFVAPSAFLNQSQWTSRGCDASFVIHCDVKSHTMLERRETKRQQGDRDSRGSATLPHYLHLQCPPGKLGARALRKEIPKIGPFLEQVPPDRDLYVVCPTGKDLSLGVALAVCCLYCDESGNRIPNKPFADRCHFQGSNDTIRVCKEVVATLDSTHHTPVDKAMIRKRLAWISSALPHANPSRATLTAVNAFLMDDRSSVHDTITER